MLALAASGLIAGQQETVILEAVPGQPRQWGGGALQWVDVLEWGGEVTLEATTGGEHRPPTAQCPVAWPLVLVASSKEGGVAAREAAGAGQGQPHTQLYCRLLRAGSKKP